jgi:hypothetical protein
MKKINRKQFKENLETISLNLVFGQWHRININVNFNGLTLLLSYKFNEIELSVNLDNRLQVKILNPHITDYIFIPLDYVSVKIVENSILIEN